MAAEGAAAPDFLNSSNLNADLYNENQAEEQLNLLNKAQGSFPFLRRFYKWGALLLAFCLALAIFSVGFSMGKANN